MRRSAHLGTELGEFVQQSVVQNCMIERVGADQLRREIVPDDPERCEPALHRRRLANAEGPVVAMDPNPGAALRRGILWRPLHLKHLDIANFHGALPPASFNPVALFYRPWPCWSRPWTNI